MDEKSIAEWNANAQWYDWTSEEGKRLRREVTIPLLEEHFLKQSPLLRQLMANCKEKP